MYSPSSLAIEILCNKWIECKLGFIEFEIKCALIGVIKDAIQKSLINPYFYIGNH